MARNRRERCQRGYGVNSRQRIRALACAWLMFASGAFAAEATRVVGIGAAITEIIYALDAGDLLVGVDTQSIYPPEATGLPQVGYVRQLSVEGLASLEPDLIIAANDAGPPHAVARIRDLGVRLILVAPAQSIPQAAERILVVADALGMPQRGEALAASLTIRAEAASARYQGVLDSRADDSRPRVALFLGRGAGSPTAAGRDTVGDAMILLAGGENVFSDISGFKPVSAEALITAAPDVVVVTRHMIDQAGSLAELVATLPGLALTPAAASGRIEAMDILELFSFGPRLPDAIIRLGEAIYPKYAGSQSGLSEMAGGE